MVSGEHDNDEMRTTVSSNSRRRPQTVALSQGHSWRDLIPVIKVDVSSVRGFYTVFVAHNMDKWKVCEYV
jgi:hypothetical protein